MAFEVHKQHRAARARGLFEEAAATRWRARSAPDPCLTAPYVVLLGAWSPRSKRCRIARRINHSREKVAPSAQRAQRALRVVS